MSEAWQGDWYERVRERARSLGFETVSDFASAHPTTSLLELADQLGERDVAAAQLIKVLIDEAEIAGTLEHCARSLFVRELRDRLPEGWQAEWDDRPLGPHSRRAAAFATWAGFFGERFDNATDRVWEVLLTLSIPEGWLPDGPDDPYISQAFQHWRDPE